MSAGSATAARAFVYGPNGGNHTMADVAALYDTSPAVRRAVDRFGAWSLVGADVLLRRRPRPAGVPLMRVNGLGLAAGMLGLTDALAEAGIEPTVVGGVSLGEQVAACAGGALSRRELVDLLMVNDQEPDSAAETESMAFVFVPPGGDGERYHRQGRLGVHVAVDFGTVHGGARLLLLGGRRRDLLRFAAADPNEVRVFAEDAGSAAHHTPLRRRGRARMAAHLAAQPLRDPRIPLCSALDGSTRRTGAGIGAALVANQVRGLRLDHLMAAVAARRPVDVVTFGPFLSPERFPFPFPVTWVDDPQTLAALCTNERRRNA